MLVLHTATAEPPLMATSHLHFFMSWWTVHTFSLVATSLQQPPPQWQQPLEHVPTAKITSRQWPVYQ